MAVASRTLVAVLANPPLTSGERTLGRVTMARELLGFTDVAIANLFSLPSHETRDIDVLGADEDGWLKARPSLDAVLEQAAGVLIAYGAGSPSGPARVHFRNQVEWLLVRIDELALPIWQVGDGPRHPSRWQRWTCRAHPNVPFADALRRSLVVTNGPKF